MASFRRDNTARNIGIAALILLLLAGGAYLIYRSAADPLRDIEDLRVKQIGLYEKLLETDPSNVDILVKIGNLYKSIGDIDRAIDYYKRALAIDPDNYAALN